MDNLEVTVPPPIELTVTPAPTILITPGNSSVSMTVSTAPSLEITPSPPAQIVVEAGSFGMHYPQIVSVNSQAEETAAFLAGAKIVIREDLL